jgi:hypothetical protein
MFLVGGPAFSGTTLLAHLLNQEGIVCLDEPDFHNPKQNHRSIPVLEKLFPDRRFPARPELKLSYGEAVKLIAECQEIIRPTRLGIKTANWMFIDYAKIYKKSGYPVITIIRDIRDALVGAPLPEWITERGLNKAYRLIWKNMKLYDLWFRYEDLVTNPENIMAEISRVLRHRLETKSAWVPGNVDPAMIKLERHRLLQEGSIVAGRVGLWKSSDKVLRNLSHKTAAIMGYRG